MRLWSFSSRTVAQLLMVDITKFDCQEKKIREKFRLLQFMGFVYSPAVCKVICCFDLIHIIYADKNIDKLSRNNFFYLKEIATKSERKLKKTTSLPQDFAFFLQ